MKVVIQLKNYFSILKKNKMLFFQTHRGDESLMMEYRSEKNRRKSDIYQNKKGSFPEPTKYPRPCPIHLFCWNEASPSFCKGNRGSGGWCGFEIYMSSKTWRGVHGGWDFMAVTTMLQNFQQRIGNWTTQALKNCEALFLIVQKNKKQLGNPILPINECFGSMVLDSPLQVHYLGWK